MKAAPNPPILHIKLENTTPIDLIDFTNSCSALAAIFQQHCKEYEGEAAYSKLLIKEVRSGSIEIDPLPMAEAAVLGMLNNPAKCMELINSMGSFIKFIGIIIKWLSNKGTPPASTPDINTLRNIEKIVNPIAKEPGSIYNINVINVNGNITAPITITNDSANIIQNTSRGLSKQLSEPKKSKVYKNCPLRWFQSRIHVTLHWARTRCW